ncbi:hypothetical protein BN1708_018328, partial [Verticillium longisporum]
MDATSVGVVESSMQVQQPGPAPAGVPTTTSKLNLEEIDHIFETPGANPVKLSVKIADAKHAQYKLDRQAEQ